MQFYEISFDLEYPEIPRIGGRAVYDVPLEELELVPNRGLVTMGINEGDYIRIPDTIHQLKLKKRQLKPGLNSYEYFINIIRNGKASWLSIHALNRRNHKGEPVHPVSKWCVECTNAAELVFAILGKCIIGKRLVDMTRFKKVGMSQEVEIVKTSYLEFD